MGRVASMFSIFLTFGLAAFSGSGSACARRPKGSKSLASLAVTLSLSWLCMVLPAHAQEVGQKPLSECVSDLDTYLAFDLPMFRDGIRQDNTINPLRKEGIEGVAAQPGCRTAAADLIELWRERHVHELGAQDHKLLSLEEGQLRATAGDYSSAITLVEFGRSAKSGAAWTAYVDAMLAFMHNDKNGLLEARKLISESGYPSRTKFADTLLACFGKRYPDPMVHDRCVP